MSNNERTYRDDINTQQSYYKITIRDFIKDLSEEGLLDDFKKDIKDSFLNVFDIACDWSIPVIMVKYFQRVGF